MKRVIKTLALHLFLIIFFTVFYYYFSTHFEKNTPNKCKNYDCNNEVNTLIDFLSFSTTIQVGVGLNEMSPTSNYSKLIIILQQLIMLSIHVITIFIFTN
jgi:hypothetical protein